MSQESKPNGLDAAARSRRINSPGTGGAGGSTVIREAANSDNPRRCTIREVAKLAGVSTATVSNVINNTGKVGRATKERVRAAIEDMNWKPDRNARSLAKR